MYNLLQSKGYDGEQKLDSVLSWFKSKNIHIDVISAFDPEDEGEFLGYVAEALFQSSYTFFHSTEIFYTREDALTYLLYSIHDYF